MPCACTVPPQNNSIAASTSPTLPITSFMLSPFFRSTAKALPEHFLAPQAQRFLYGTVGKAEQDRVCRRLVRDLAPRGHDKDVMRLPLEGFVAHLAAAASLDGAIH